jgi:competence protein ComEC
VRVPASLLALPLVAGTAAGILLDGSAPERLIVASAAAAVFCALSGLAFFLDDLAGGLVVCVVAGAGFAGHSLGASTTRDLLSPPLLAWFEALPKEREGPAVVEGLLREDAASVGYGVLLNVAVTAVGDPAARELSRGGVRLVVGGNVAPEQIAEWRAGRLIRAPAALRRPASYFNPGVPDDLRAQALRGVILTGSIKSAALVEVLRKGDWLEERAAAVRAWTRRVMATHVGPLDARSAGVATAILIGDRTGLSTEDERRLQDAGTYHVIAISGGNIAILTALLVGAARLLRVPYRLAAGVSLLVLLFYGEVAGGAPSVARAVTAAVLVLWALLVDHRGAALNVLAVAAALAIGVRPVTPADGGFLLSFGATAGILLGVPRLAGLLAPSTEGRRRPASTVLRVATGIVIATVCAEIALAPVAATLFSRVTLAGLVLNFVAIPLMTLVQCGSLALLAAASLSTKATEWLALLVHWSAWGLVESARFVEVAPWLARDVPPPGPWLTALYYGACGAALFAPRARRAAAAVFVLCAGALAGGFSSANGVEPTGKGVLRVVMLDVGQGDATVAILPGGKAILVDAGGLAGTTFDMGAHVVVPALRALGVRTLHALVLTHGDPDHVGGAPTVLERLPTANVWEGVPVPPHAPLRILQTLADGRRTAWRTVRAGDAERHGAVRLRVLHPPEPDWERQRVRNDDAIVLELRHGGVSILLPGDIGREGEAAVIPQLDPAPIVILKAGHHGSATSSTDAFLDAVRPRAVIFSAGRNNRFGHPAPVVVDRVARRGVPTFSTADDGAVFVESDGQSVRLRGWHSGRQLVISQQTEEK